MRVLGLGNALVDILAKMENDQLLYTLHLPKGSMQLVDDEQSKKISEAVLGLKKAQASGGSAANTIHGLANLGVSTGFIGMVGTDVLGQFFKSDMEQNKISAHLAESALNGSGYCTSLIGPDSERTMATYLGAAVELSASDLREELFRNYHYFHVEGYLVQNHLLIETALKMARQNGLRVSLDLASFNVVDANHAFLTRLVKEYVDVLFANEEEARSFTGKTDMEALLHMGSMADVVVLKLGSKGSLIKHFDEVVSVGVIPVKSVDTTGAGDLYAAGFLYGLLEKLSPELCGKLGAIVSGYVIEVLGPKMDAERWSKVKQAIQQARGAGI